MAGLCKAVIIGHIGRDPEVRYTQGGMAITNFSVAATEKVKGQDKTEWFKVIAFGKLGEICGQYLSKGRQVYIEGRLQSSEWEDQQGNKRFSLEVVADTCQMLGTKSDNQGGYQNSQQTTQAAPKQNINPETGLSNAIGGNTPTMSDAPMESPDDDIPF